MTHPMPTTAPALMRDRAELDTLRGIVRRMFAEHARMARIDGFEQCMCSDCRSARPFIPVEVMP